MTQPQTPNAVLSTLTLSSPVRFVKGVGPVRAEQLAGLGVATVWDLLHHFPRGYQDRSHLVPIEKIEAGMLATVKGIVSEVGFRRIRGRTRSLVNVMIEDGTGMIRATWFNQPYLRQTFHKGDRVIISGMVRFYDVWEMAAPEFEILDSEEDQGFHTNRIVPLHPLTAGLSARVFRNIIQPIVETFAGQVADVLPEELLAQRGLCGIERALRDIHFPESNQALAAAQKRLKYEDVFLLETAMAVRRASLKGASDGIAFQINERIDEHIRRRFPFTLTAAQEKVIREIAADMASPHPMNRLLQGDVGSGKTVVAIYAMLVAVANGYQAAIMAPTEILAEQHFNTLNRYLAGSKVRIDLLVGGATESERTAVREAVRLGQVDIVIGTHALIENPVEFAKLGVVVIDEQHKFGVLQRGRLRWKGHSPDVLVMTATPIPRTLALTVFGDLDVSTITQLPPGRKPVKTAWVPRGKQRDAWEFVRKQIHEGRQAFVVYPLVEESEKLDLKAATQMAERLGKHFPEIRVGLLHGRMKPEEKDRIMTDFREGRIQLLVSTVVIEVGIDVPNASVMVIEHAERFGLAQLHQLRGRIGRGEHLSHCLLFSDSRSPEARQRLQVMTESSDGFRIAEEDLKLRGPGEFFGTLQHGLPRLRIADLIEDIAIVREVRDDAFAWVECDPTLSTPAGSRLRQGIELQFGESLNLVEIG